MKPEGEVVRLYEGPNPAFLVGIGNLSGFLADSERNGFRNAFDEEDGEERGRERGGGSGEDWSRRGVFFCTENMLYFWSFHLRVALSLSLFLSLSLSTLSLSLLSSLFSSFLS